MATIHRTADAVWHGTGREGQGALSTQSGVLSATPYSFVQRFGDAPGTNPEELLAAAHAGCFTMALAFGLQGAGLTPTSLETKANVSLEQETGGYRVTRSALTLKAMVPDVTAELFEQIALGAKANCPVSKLFNTEVTLEWSLA